MCSLIMITDLFIHLPYLITVPSIPAIPGLKPLLSAWQLLTFPQSNRMQSPILKALVKNTKIPLTDQPTSIALSFQYVSYNARDIGALSLVMCFTMTYCNLCTGCIVNCEWMHDGIVSQLNQPACLLINPQEGRVPLEGGVESKMMR